MYRSLELSFKVPTPVLFKYAIRSACGNRFIKVFFIGLYRAYSQISAILYDKVVSTILIKVKTDEISKTIMTALEQVLLSCGFCKLWLWNGWRECRVQTQYRMHSTAIPVTVTMVYFIYSESKTNVTLTF